MGEHADRSGKDERDDATQAMPPVSSSRLTGTEQETEAAPKRRRAEVDWRKQKDRVIGFIASLVRWVGLIFALVLVLDIIFVIGDANAENGIVSWVKGWADSLSIGFKDLFTPDDAKLRVLINYGIAALFWLIVSAVLARIIRRVGGVNS